MQVPTVSVPEVLDEFAHPRRLQLADVLVLYSILIIIINIAQ